MMSLLAAMMAVAVTIGGPSGGADIWDVATDGGPSTRVATVDVTPGLTGVCVTIGLDWDNPLQVQQSETWTVDGKVTAPAVVPVGRMFHVGLIGHFLAVNFAAETHGWDTEWQPLTSIDVGGRDEVTVCR